MGADPVEVDSDHYTVELENDDVRVLRIKYGPGEKSVLHGHPVSIGIALTNARVKMHFPDGTSEEMVLNAGAVDLYPAGEHLPENLNDDRFEVVLVELKGKE